MKINKNKEAIGRRTFLSDMGKTIFYAGLSASVIPSLFNTGCSKDDEEMYKKLKSADCKTGHTYNCPDYITFTCFDSFECSIFECDDYYDCLTNFDCSSTYACLSDDWCTKFVCSSGNGFDCTAPFHHSGGSIS